MATLSKGYTFGATEQVTAAKLHSLVDSATITLIQTADISDSQITNAKISDVSGAKFTNLSSTPSGAGALPLANGGTASTTATDARAALGLGSMATQVNTAVNIDGGTIDGITDLAVADGGTGASTAGDARTNLGLGSIATQAANNVAITGGTVAGAAIATTVITLESRINDDGKTTGMIWYRSNVP